jgi:lactoylglutathione lyase
MRVPDLPAPAGPVPRGGLAHVAFSVGGPAAVDRLTEALRGAGHVIQGEPRRTGDGYYESVVLDPDGNVVEIAA